MKSWQIARAMLLKGAAQPQTMAATRWIAATLKDSVIATLEGQAEILGLGGEYQFFNKHARARNGNKILFKGLGKNITSIKSLEGCRLIWNEECNEMTHDVMNILYPTIRMAGSQIINSFNPYAESDPVYVRHVKNHDSRISYLAEVTYLDNPFIDKEFINEAERMRAYDPDAYAHIYLGKCWAKSHAQVFSGKWVVEEFEPEFDWFGAYHGADWGFSTDPTVLIRCWIGAHKVWGERCLYIDQEAYGLHTELDDIPHLFDKIPNARKRKIRADNSRPETISHVKKKGFTVEAAKKWDGSVEDGIEYIRSFDKIIIHPRCEHTAEEARLYSHKVDKLTKDVLVEIIDKHNHCWDAVRYSLDPMVRERLLGYTQKQIQAQKAAPKNTIAPKENRIEW